ncbi:MAG: hypothetical protein WA579_01935, partial [Rhodomicrobium sp.]
MSQGIEQPRKSGTRGAPNIAKFNPSFDVVSQLGPLFDLPLNTLPLGFGLEPLGLEFKFSRFAFEAKPVGRAGSP